MSGHARDYVADALRTVPEFTVHAYPRRAPEGRPKSGTAEVAVYRTGWSTPRDSSIEHEITVNVYSSASASSEDVEAALDVLMDHAAVALQRAGACKLTRAERMTFDGDVAGWTLSVVVTTDNYIRTEARRLIETEE